jgi:hypothetical protein
MQNHTLMFFLELALMALLTALFGGAFYVLTGELSTTALVLIASGSYGLSMFIVFAIGSQRHGK